MICLLNLKLFLNCFCMNPTAIAANVQLNISPTHVNHIADKKTMP
jgi:hypothetical protein